MRFLIGALVLAAAGLAAGPGNAGVGQCIWEHLPQVSRDALFAKPNGLPRNGSEMNDAIMKVIEESDLEAATTACAGADKTRDDQVTHAFSGYMMQHWAEHWLFLYPPHLAPAQLERGYRGVDPALTAAMAAEAPGSERHRADIQAAMPVFRQALGVSDPQTPETEQALGLYLIGRADREAAEAALRR